MATASISALNNRVGPSPGKLYSAEIPEVLAGYIVSYVFPVRIIRDAGEVLP